MLKIGSFKNYLIKYIVILSLTFVFVQPLNVEAYENVIYVAKSVELPDGFPDYFPFPMDFTVTEAKHVLPDQYTRENYLVRGTSKKTTKELFKYYYEALNAASFDITYKVPSGIFYFSNDSFSDCSVLINDSGAKRHITINLPIKVEN